jgi:hypothetical protein
MRQAGAFRIGVSYLLVVLVLALGASGVVAGEADDSPGLQLLGVVCVAAGIVLAVRTARRGR